MYGEDEGRYRYQKRFDTVIDMEKEGFGLPLTSFFSEEYEKLSCIYGMYAKSKASVLFQLIENNMGTKDAMRLTFKQIIRSPLLSIPLEHRSRLLSGNAPQNTIGRTLPEGGQSPLHYSNLLANEQSAMEALPTRNIDKKMLLELGPKMNLPTEDSSLFQKVTSGAVGGETAYGSIASSQTSPRYITTPSDASHLNGSLSPATPFFASTPFSPHYGMGSIDDPQSPDPYHANSPYHTYDVHQSPYSFSNSGLGIPNLLRQVSVTSEKGWEKDFTLLSIDCLSIENFLLTARIASGASADIDTAFADKLIYNSGVHFIRLNVGTVGSLDRSNKKIRVCTEQVGLRMGGALGQEHAVKDQLLLRIVEALDEKVKEPMVKISGSEERLEISAYTRSGKRGRTKDNDLGKSTMRWLRDRPVQVPIRCAILDPLLLGINEVHNISSDALSIEQLYLEIGENNVFWQCQACRSLARGGQGEGGSLCIQADDAEETPATIERPEKSKQLQLRALMDVLYAVTPNVQGVTSVKIVSSHSVFVRIEAAFALANWQNIHAPRSIQEDFFADASEELDGIGYQLLCGGEWQAMHLLINYLYELYADPTTMVPLASDFSNESSTALRNALLLAISTIRSESGHTPAMVVQTVLDFARQNEEYCLVASSQKSSDNHSLCHYRAILLTALGRMRFENVASFLLGGPVSEIIALAKGVISTAYAEAKTRATAHYLHDDINLLPALADGGIDVAAAITLLAEMDCHAMELYTSTEDFIPGSNESKLLEERKKAIKEYLSSPIPFGVGLETNFNYKRYFKDPSSTLKCTSSQFDEPKSSSILDYAMTPLLVRASAYEAFCRLCFAHYSVYYRRNRANYGGSQNQSNEVFIVAAIEALTIILKISESRWSKQQAALSLFCTIMDKPYRASLQGIVQDNPWYCYGWSDPMGFTLAAPHFHYKSEYQSAMKSDSDRMRIGLSILWKYIASSNYDQVKHLHQSIYSNK